MLLHNNYGSGGSDSAISNVHSYFDVLMEAQEVIQLDNDSDGDDEDPLALCGPPVVKIPIKDEMDSNQSTSDTSSVIVLDSESDSDSSVQSIQYANGDNLSEDEPVIAQDPSPDANDIDKLPTLCEENEVKPVEEPIVQVTSDANVTLTVGPTHRKIAPVSVPAAMSSSVDEPRPGPSRRRESTRSNNGADETISPEKRRKLDRVERQILDLMRQVEKEDSREVDWDDEHNSAYLIKDRMTVKLVQYYERLASAAGENGTLTGRPMQKTFSVKQVTRYPEVDTAVEKFLNKFCKMKATNKHEVAYATPEYNDILDVVSQTVKRDHLTVVPGEKERMAQDLFKYTVKLYKKRRAKELKIAIPDLFNSDAAQEDPAERDPELKRKLQENIRMRRTEEEVLKEFVAKENDRGAADGMDTEGDDDDDEEEVLPPPSKRNRGQSSNTD